MRLNYNVPCFLKQGFRQHYSKLLFVGAKECRGKCVFIGWNKSREDTWCFVALGVLML